MKTDNPKTMITQITLILQICLNVSLVGIALVLCFFLGFEIYTVVRLGLYDPTNIHDALQEVLGFFLYFGFVSMIVKYFQEGYHFPIRYLLYIGITATIRFIIVNRDNPTQNLILSLVVILLLFGYIILYKFRIKQ